MEDKYTWDDIIINPNDHRLEGAIGKQVYTANSPFICVRKANRSGDYKELTRIDSDLPCPFITQNSSWNCIILKKEPTYAERQAEWIKENDIKIGDRVRVTRKAESCEDGWENLWGMDEYVGKTITVTEFFGSAGIQCGDYAFPYFVLEKVVEPEKKYVPFDLSKEEDRNIIRDKWLIKLYCGNFAKEECRIIGFSENAAILSVTYDDVYGHKARCITGTELLEKFTFLDGTPCGKEVEE